jgi:hypothetical protein
MVLFITTTVRTSNATGRKLIIFTFSVLESGAGEILVTVHN